MINLFSDLPPPPGQIIWFLNEIAKDDFPISILDSNNPVAGEGMAHDYRGVSRELDVQSKEHVGNLFDFCQVGFLPHQDSPPISIPSSGSFWYCCAGFFIINVIFVI